MTKRESCSLLTYTELPLPHGFTAAAGLAARRLALDELEIRSGMHNIDKIKAAGRALSTINGYLNVLLGMLRWCRERRRRISAECWRERILEYALSKGMPDPGSIGQRTDWSPQTTEDSQRVLKAALDLLGLGVARKDREASALKAALEYSNKLRIPQHRAGLPGVTILKAVKHEWNAGSRPVARLLLVGTLVMMRPAEIVNFDPTTWQRRSGMKGERSLTSFISDKTHRQVSREVTWPEGPAGSTWQLIWLEAWQAAVPPQATSYTALPTAADLKALRYAVKQLGIDLGGLRPSGYNLWRSRGLAEDVVNSMGAWAANSKIPAKHYLRVELLSSLVAAAASIPEME